MEDLRSRRPDHALANSNRLKLGLFGINVDGGMAGTTVPERWSASWDNNVAAARMAEEAGLDFLLPLARWRGHGGESHFQDHGMETVTWAAGLLAKTSSISVLATTHAAFFHPVAAAKQLATVDGIGAGRYGLNLVCGWNAAENAMFGLDLPADSEARYAYGQEWLDLLRKILSSPDPFDWDGRYFQLRDVFLGSRLSHGSLPPIMNAGASPTGLDFGARNADALFITLLDLEKAKADIASTKAQAASRYGRSVDIYTPCYVVCRPTIEEAQAYHRYYAEEKADWDAVDAMMEAIGMRSQSFPPEFYAMFRTRFAGGHGGYPLIGDPDTVAAEIIRISDAGFAGISLNFVNYLDEFPYFRDEVLPRLAAAGLRDAVHAGGLE